jgi:hypothetical protein
MTTNNSTNNDKLTTNGYLYIGSTGASPVAATLTAGSGISITNGAGSISIATAATGGYVLLGTGTANNTATSISFTGLTGYAAIKIIANNVQLATSNSSLNLNCSINNGSSYDTGNNYAWSVVNTLLTGSPTPTGVGGSATSIIGVLGTGAAGVTNSATYFHNFELTFFAPNIKAFAQFYYSAVWVNTSPAYVGTSGFGNYYNTGNTIEAIQFVTTGGNIVVGSFYVYGLVT